MALLIPFHGKRPRVAEDAFLAPNAVLVGDVRVEARASVWFGAILRADDPDHPIVVGPGANVQDGAIVHVGAWGPTLVGPNVTVGHGAVFESCEIGEGTLVGMNAVILQEAVVGRECLLAAGTVVLEGARIPDRSVVAGVPGVVRKTLEGSAAGWVTRSGKHYVELSRSYLAQGIDRIAFLPPTPPAPPDGREGSDG
jgi:carbonic anhydrase/acetyltransferase-like protein (isoleucine patch superfamily)